MTHDTFVLLLVLLSAHIKNSVSPVFEIFETPSKPTAGQYVICLEDIQNLEQLENPMLCLKSYSVVKGWL